MSVAGAAHAKGSRQWIGDTDSASLVGSRVAAGAAFTFYIQMGSREIALTSSHHPKLLCNNTMFMVTGLTVYVRAL